MKENYDILIAILDSEKDREHIGNYLDQTMQGRYSLHGVASNHPRRGKETVSYMFKPLVGDEEKLNINYFLHFLLERTFESKIASKGLVRRIMKEIEQVKSSDERFWISFRDWTWRREDST